MATALEQLTARVETLQGALETERQKRKDLETKHDQFLAAAANPRVQVQTNKLPLPKFTGEGDDSAGDCRRFLRSLDAYISQTDFTEKQKTDLFRAALQTGTTTSAARWWDNILDAGEENTSTYARCAKLLRLRYEHKQTTSQLVSLVDSLIQKDKEPVLDFADRVNSVARDFVRTLPSPLHELLDAQGDSQIKEAIQDAWARLHFIVGLQKNIKSKTLIQAFTSFSDVRTIADRVEMAEKERTPRVTATTYTDVPTSRIPTVVLNALQGELGHNIDASTLEAAVAALATRGRPGRGRGRGRGRGGQSTTTRTATSGSTRGQAKPAWVTPRNLPAEYCLRCGFKGHAAAQCTVLPERFRWAQTVKELQLTPDATLHTLSSAQQQPRNPMAQLTHEHQDAMRQVEIEALDSVAAQQHSDWPLF